MSSAPSCVDVKTFDKFGPSLLTCVLVRDLTWLVLSELTKDAERPWTIEVVKEATADVESAATSDDAIPLNWATLKAVACRVPRSRS